MAEQDPAYGSGATDPNAPIGTAFMREDGVIEMMLRAQSADGTFGEAMIVVYPSEERYAGIVAHLDAIEPGESRTVRPFPPEEA